MIADLLSGETGFLVGLLVGQAAGVMLCRWLWINGQMRKAKKAPDNHAE